MPVKRLNPDQIRIVNQLKDLTAGRFDSSNSFLHYLPFLLEYQQLSPSSYKSFLQFVQDAATDSPQPQVLDALRILDQIVSSEDGTLITPNRGMFAGNRYYNWSELGTRTDSTSVIMHLVNKAAYVLNLSRA